MFDTLLIAKPTYMMTVFLKQIINLWNIFFKLARGLNELELRWVRRRTRRDRERLYCVREHLVWVHICVYVEKKTRKQNKTLSSDIVIGHSSLRLHEPEPINYWKWHLSVDLRTVFSSVVSCLTWSVIFHTLCLEEQLKLVIIITLMSLSVSALRPHGCVLPV